MHSGKVKWFNNAKGYGFVICEDFDEDLFVHYSAIDMDGYKTLKAGQPVMFETMPGPKGIHAVNIKPLPMQPRKQTAQEQPDAAEMQLANSA